MTSAQKALFKALLMIVRELADILIARMGEARYQAILSDLERAAGGTDEFTFDGALVRWGEGAYAATSGPWGKGRLPEGRYRIAWRRVVEGLDLAAGFRGADGDAWFVPLEPVDVPELEGRSGFGLHPDGGTPGSRGCVAFIGPAAGLFMTRVRATPIGERPDALVVSYPDAIP